MSPTNIVKTDQEVLDEIRDKLVESNEIVAQAIGDNALLLGEVMTALRRAYGVGHKRGFVRGEAKGKKAEKDG